MGNRLLTSTRVCSIDYVRNARTTRKHFQYGAVRPRSPHSIYPLNFNKLGRIKSGHQVFIFKNIPHLIADHSCIVSSSYCSPFFDCSICFSMIAFTCAKETGVKSLLSTPTSYCAGRSILSLGASFPVLFLLV